MLVRETVGLLQVLGSQKDRGPVLDQLPDGQPHVDPALGVEPGRRLVQEDDGRVAHQAHGDVEPAAHPTREGEHVAVGGLVEVELVQQLGGGLPRIGDAAQLAYQHQVLPGAEHVVHRGELPGQAYLFANLGGLLRHVEPSDARRAAIGLDQRGQDVDRGRLARAVGSEQSEDRAPPDGERDVVEYRYSLVSLHEVSHLDGVACSISVSHVVPLRSVVLRTCDQDIAELGAGANLDRLGCLFGVLGGGEVVVEPAELGGGVDPGRRAVPDA